MKRPEPSDSFPPIEEEREQCRKRVRRAQFDLKQTSNKNDEIKRKIAEAERTIRNLKDELLQVRDETWSKEKPFSAAVSEYAKADCRAFCAAFHKALPTEIRELVYEELDIWPAGDEISVHDDKDGYFTPYFKLFARGSPHWYSPDFCGDVAVELVERAYRTTKYSFLVSNLHLLDRFIATDVYGINVVPTNFVRDIEITMSGKDLYVQTTLDEVIAALKKIGTSIKSRCANVEVYINGRSSRLLTDVIDFCGRLGPAVYGLKGLGFNVGITIDLFANIIRGQRYEKDVVLQLPETLDMFVTDRIPNCRAIFERLDSMPDSDDSD